MTRFARSRASAVAALLGSVLIFGGCASGQASPAGHDGGHGSSHDGDTRGHTSRHAAGDMGSGEHGGAMGAMSMTTLASTTTHHMRVEVASSAPEIFKVLEGTELKTHRPSSGDDMHLMVVLSDPRTGQRVPYASVQARVETSDGTRVYDERLWPMISRTMGTHYGNNVDLPGKGTYQVSLVITPPQTARHKEYFDIWTEPFRVTETFSWKRQ